MSNRFKSGLIFGAGFAISFSVISSLSGLLVMFYPQFESPAAAARLTHTTTTMSPDHTAEKFFDLPVEQRIAKSSAIALLRFEAEADGRQKAVIKEFLKKDPGVELYYDVGDEYSSMSFYPEADTSRGDGAVVFFAGSPATMRAAVTYEGNRIGGLGDISLELFKEKCEEAEKPG